MRHSINEQCSTEAGLRDYITNNYIPEISPSDLDQLLRLYPADITQGSPFNTSILNALTPEFKRLAAMQGDLVFQAPRRFFLQNRSSKQSTWSFCESRRTRWRLQSVLRLTSMSPPVNKRLKALPALGSVCLLASVWLTVIAYLHRHIGSWNGHPERIWWRRHGRLPYQLRQQPRS